MLAFLTLLPLTALAAPSLLPREPPHQPEAPPPPLKPRGPTHVPLFHNPRALARRQGSLARRSPGERPWTWGVREHVRRKYGAREDEGVAKRGKEEGVPLGNGLDDSLYYATVSFGTPSQSFNLLMDTGSSDLWIASPACTDCPSVAPRFEPNASSTYHLTDTPFLITYGSGNATGTMAADAVTLGGIPAPGGSALFAVVNQSTGILRSDLAMSGVAGFGWSSIARSGVTPLWEALAEDGTLPARQTMSFALTRASSLSASAKMRRGRETELSKREMLRMKEEERALDSLEDAAGEAGDEAEVASAGAETDSDGGSSSDGTYGGVLTLGGLNQSLFKGDVNYVNVTNKGYWMIEMEGVSVNGKQANLAGGRNVAIDTGTSLIAAPSADCKELYQQIPGAEPTSDPSFPGYWEFPCNSNAGTSIALQFGGISYPMDPQDFNIGTSSSGNCLGSVFALELAGNSSTTPQWIVGDAFLKNVYSVFQFNPAAVGFAALSDSFAAENKQTTAAPSNVNGSTAGTSGPATTNSTSGATSEGKVWWLTTLSLGAATAAALMGM